MKSVLKNLCTVYLSCSVFVTLSFSVFAKSPENYTDMDSIVGVDVESSIPRTLGIIYPKTVSTTTDDSFYIAGTSDPDKPLYMNDEELTDRNSNGLFEVTVSVPQDGAYSCVFKQEDEVKVVPIFKNVQADISYNGFALPNVISKNTTVIDSSIFPTNNIVITDKMIKLQCTAAAGSVVNARFCGSTFSLSQDNPTTSLGVVAKYSTMVDLSSYLEDDKSYDLGNVVYEINREGELSEKCSIGKIYYSKDCPPFVRVSWRYATLRDNPNNGSNILSVLKKGVVDRVIKEENEFYRLGCGAWINKKFVEPIFEKIELTNNITAVEIDKDEKSEKLILKGNSNPIFTSGIINDKLIVRLYNTIGELDLSSVSQDSSLFKEVSSKNEENYLELTFNFISSDFVWGYSVEFDGDNTIIYVKKRPEISDDSLYPLRGITVLVDAGHGGSDTGALGLIGEIGGPCEKDINLINSLAVKRRLESLGANVIMTRDEDKFLSLSDRASIIESTKPDFVIIIHADATLNNVAKGLTVHCTRNNMLSSSFSSLIGNIASNYIERDNRGVKFTDFYVLLGSICPLAFLESGFLTNLTDTASLFSSQGVFDLSNAVGDSIVKYLSNTVTATNKN